MRVDAPLDGGQQRRLAVVAAADDDGHPRPDGRAPHPAGVRKLHDGGQRFRRPQWHGASAHGRITDPGAARKLGAVGEEGDPPVLAHGPRQRAVVLERGNVGGQPFGPPAGQIQGGSHLPGQVTGDDAGGLVPLDGAPARRQGHTGADLQRPGGGTGRLLAVLPVLLRVGVGQKDDGGALQDLLAR